MKKKQLYIAYGSNINLEQMAFRCPHSSVVGDQCQQLKRYWHLPCIKNQIEYLGQNTLH